MSNAEEHVVELPETEDTLHVAAKGWNRVISAAEKVGYTEGIEDGSESVFQEAFDQGYADAFQTAFTLGKFKSLLNVIPKDRKYPPDINKILDKTRRGACYICKIEDKVTKQVPENKTFTEIVDEQRIHSAEILQRLQQYFKPDIQESALEIPDIS